MAVKKKGGLGKGLDALIAPAPAKKAETVTKPTVKPEKTIVEKIVEVEKPMEVKLPIEEIEPNREQPRKNFDEDALHELSESIKQFGILQPLLVQKKEDYYSIIAGERRWRAARIAGLKEVPVIIKEYTPAETVQIALIENIQRENLNPIEEAEAFARLIEEFGLKQDEAAERVSKSRTAVTNSMRLLKLDQRVKQMIIDDMISSGHGRALIPIENKDDQYYVAMKVFDHKMSVRETEKLVKGLLNKKPEKPKEIFDQSKLAFNEIEEKIKTIIGTKVTINQKSDKKGKIEIEYYSMEELERIIDLFESIN